MNAMLWTYLWHVMLVWQTWIIDTLLWSDWDDCDEAFSSEFVDLGSVAVAIAAQEPADAIESGLRIHQTIAT